MEWDPASPPLPVAVDCGSGGTRAFEIVGGEFQRIAWPGEEKAPVLSKVLASHDEDTFCSFALGIAALGEPAFVGATAGVRHALEHGDVQESDVKRLRALFPSPQALHILSPQEEARCELAALRHVEPSASAMLTMGGKSMQLGGDDALYSFPFAMHLGYEELQRADPALPWRESVASVSDLFDERCAAEWERPPLAHAKVCCATDCTCVGERLRLLNRPVRASEFIQAVDTAVVWLGDRSGLQPRDLIFLARALAMRAVVARALAPDCVLLFSERFAVNWVEGYLRGGLMRSREGRGGPGADSSQAEVAAGPAGSEAGGSGGGGGTADGAQDQGDKWVFLGDEQPAVKPGEPIGLDTWVEFPVGPVRLL